MSNALTFVEAELTFRGQTIVWIFVHDDVWERKDPSVTQSTFNHKITRWHTQIFFSFEIKIQKKCHCANLENLFKTSFLPVSGKTNVETFLQFIVESAKMCFEKKWISTMIIMNKIGSMKLENLDNFLPNRHQFNYHPSTYSFPIFHACLSWLLFPNNRPQESLSLKPLDWEVRNLSACPQFYLNNL